MSTELSKTPEKMAKMKKIIYCISVIVPIAVAALFSIKIEGIDFSFLPPIYATINGVTAVLLIAALLAIKAKNMKLHSTIMRICLGLSLLFLLLYIAYHITSDATPYGGTIGSIYYPLLITHIVMSVVVIPLVLLTYLWAWEGNFKKHKKWTRISFPIWLFVAISGVVVYVMISPYYV